MTYQEFIKLSEVDKQLFFIEKFNDILINTNECTLEIQKISITERRNQTGYLFDLQISVIKDSKILNIHTVCFAYDKDKNMLLFVLSPLTKESIKIKKIQSTLDTIDSCFDKILHDYSLMEIIKLNLFQSHLNSSLSYGFYRSVQINNFFDVYFKNNELCEPFYVCLLNITFDNKFSYILDDMIHISLNNKDEANTNVEIFFYDNIKMNDRNKKVIILKNNDYYTLFENAFYYSFFKHYYKIKRKSRQQLNLIQMQRC